MKRLAQVLVVAILASCVGVSFAGGGGGGGGGRGGRGGGGGGGMGGMGGGMGGMGGAMGGGMGGAMGGGAMGGGAMGGNINNGFGGAQLQGGGAGGGGRAGQAAANAVPAFLRGIDINFYTNQYVTMLIELTVSADQKPLIKGKVDTMNTELQAYIQNSQATARGTIATAGAAGSTLTPAQLKQRDDFLLLADGHQVKIDAELTDEQKVQWETYKINRWLDPHLAGINLTDDQKGKVRTLVGDAAKAVGKATDAADAEAQLGRLYRKVISDVLTESQASLLLVLQTGVVGGASGTAIAAGGVGGANVAGAVGGAQGGAAGGAGGGGRAGRGGGGGGAGGAMGGMGGGMGGMGGGMGGMGGGMGGMGGGMGGMGGGGGGGRGGRGGGAAGGAGGLP